MKLYLNQTMDKLQLGCQSSGGICFGSGLCDGVEVVVVVGSDSVSGSSDSNIPTQLLLQFTTLRCKCDAKDTSSEISFAITFPTHGIQQTQSINYRTSRGDPRYLLSTGTRIVLKLIPFKLGIFASKK